MFITKKHISRRTVLKGAGVALGLPFLDAMVPAGTALAQTAAGRGHQTVARALPVLSNLFLVCWFDRCPPECRICDLLKPESATRF